jgi:pimeloyl-ACP methyl ester carboxylesterase
MVDRHVVFSHGKDSSPYSRKIQTLDEIASSEGYIVSAVDFRGVTRDIDRVSVLSDFCKDLSGEMVLVGSSIGAYASIAAAPTLHTRGLFLLAPAIYVPELPPLRLGAIDCPVTVVHGWRDDVIPYEESIRFTKEYRGSLHLVESDHRLHSALPLIRTLFQYFIMELDFPTPIE